MRVALVLITFIPGYWLCISHRGFGGLFGLFFSPVALLLAFAMGAVLRRAYGVRSRLHLVDVLGVAVVLFLAYVLIPSIK